MYKRKGIMKEETRKKIGLAQLGRKHPHSDETKERIRLIMKQKVTPEFRERMKKARGLRSKGLYLDVETKERMRQNALVRKEWDGNINSLVYRVRRHFRYKLWKQEVFEKHPCCSVCKSKKGLHLHHKTKLFQIVKNNVNKLIAYDFDIPELWDVTNGEALCGKCHNSLHRQEGGTRISCKELLRKVIIWDNKTNHILDTSLRENILELLTK